MWLNKLCVCKLVLSFPFHYFNTSHKFLQSEFCMTLVLSCVEVQDIKWLGHIDPFTTLALSLTTVFCLFFLSPGPEVKMISGRMSRAHNKILAGYLWWTSSSCLNPLHANISMHILHTIINTFPKVLTRRICLLIKSFFHWWSFPLFSRP